MSTPPPNFPTPSAESSPIPASNTPVWDDGRWSPLPELEGEITCGTCVVGLGGSGLTAIQELMDRGEDVVGVDARDVGAGAAGRNGGFLLAGAYHYYHDAVALYGRAQARAIYAASLEEMARMVEVAPDTVRFVGSRRLAATPTEITDCREQERALRADDWPVEWYDNKDGVGLYFPRDASFNPLARCRTLALTQRARGARLFGRSPVLQLTGTRIATERGVIHCRRAIVAVDGNLEHLFPELRGVVRTARLQMLATAPTTKGVVPCPTSYREGFEYWQQLADGSIALGGFRDQGGDSEWTSVATPTEPVQSLLERFLREKLCVQTEITHRWAGLVSYSENGMPILGEIRDGLWVIGAYCGTGNVIGALAARAVVGLAVDGNSSRASVLLSTGHLKV